MHAHGGHLAVTSDAAHGTTFTATLPRNWRGPRGKLSSQIACAMIAVLDRYGRAGPAYDKSRGGPEPHPRGEVEGDVARTIAAAVAGGVSGEVAKALWSDGER